MQHRKMNRHHQLLPCDRFGKDKIVFCDIQVFKIKTYTVPVQVYCTYYRIQYTVILSVVHCTDIHSVDVCTIVGTFYIVYAIIN